MQALATAQALETAFNLLIAERTNDLLDTIKILENRINQMENYYQKTYLQQKEVCREFGIGHRTLKQWVNGGLPEIWLANRVYYDRKDIEVFLETHKV